MWNSIRLINWQRDKLSMLDLIQIRFRFDRLAKFLLFFKQFSFETKLNQIKVPKWKTVFILRFYFFSFSLRCESDSENFPRWKMLTVKRKVVDLQWNVLRNETRKTRGKPFQCYWRCDFIIICSYNSCSLTIASMLVRQLCPTTEVGSDSAAKSEKSLSRKNRKNCVKEFL